MNQNNNLLVSLGLTLTVAISSCTKSNDSIVYTPEILDKADVDSISLSLIETEFDFGFPETIDFVSDSLMILFDTNINDKIAHLIDINGNFITSFGNKGRGEGEIIKASDISLNEKKDSVFIYDYVIQRILGYNLDNLINGRESAPSVLQIEINDIPGQEYRFMHVERGNGNTFFCFSSAENRIVAINNSATKSIYTDYPDVDPDLETNRSIWNYSGSRNSISPDGSKLVVATYIGGLFETFDIKGSELSSRAVRGFFKPDYVYANGAIPKCVTFNPENIVTGFRTIYASDDHFITVVDGHESERMNEILTFDYDGNLLSRKATGDGRLNIIAENPKGEIYAIAYNNEFTQMNLYRIED